MAIDWNTAGDGLMAFGAGLLSAGAGGGRPGSGGWGRGLSQGLLGAQQAMSDSRRDAMQREAFDIRRREAEEEQASGARYREAFDPNFMGPLSPAASTLRDAVPESQRGLLAVLSPRQGMAQLPGLLQRSEEDRSFAGLLAGMPRPGAPSAMPVGPQAGNMPPPEMMPHFEQASRETGIPVPLLVAQAAQESGFRPDAVGRAGEIGMAQIMPSTARDPGFGVQPITPEQARDPAQAALFQARYLAARANAANGGTTDWNNPAHVDAGLRAYNGGGDPNYVQNVRRRMAVEPVPGAAPAMPSGDVTPAQNAIPADIPGRGNGVPVPGMAELAQAQQFRAVAQRFASSSDPRAQGLARQYTSQAEGLERRAEAERVRQDNPLPTVTLGDGPHGPAGVYQRERGGGFTRIGNAAPPTSTVNVDTRGQSAYEQERGKGLAGEEAAVRAGTTAAGNTLMRLGTIERALDQFTTGATSGARITVGQIAQQLGVPDAVLSGLGLSRDSVAQGEQIRSTASNLLLGMIGPGGFPSQNFSNADREMLERALPSLMNSPGGNRVIIGIMRAQAERTRDIGRAWNDWRRTNGNGSESFDRFQQERLPQITDSDVLAPLLGDYVPASGPDMAGARPGVQADPPPPATRAPIRVATPDEYARLPSGTPFVAPDGSTRVKP